MRLKSLAELIALMIVALCSLALLGWGGTSAWFASPTSPIVSPVHSPMPVESTPGTLGPAEPAAPLWRASLWTSPLPWVAVGLPLFGLFAWALSAMLRRSRPDPP